MSGFLFLGGFRFFFGRLGGIVKKGKLLGLECADQYNIRIGLSLAG